MAALYLQANGLRVTSADVSIPYYGAATADLVFPSGVTLTNPVSVVVANLTLTMAVLRQATFAGGASARLVGGFGGWQKTLPAAFYSNPSGIALSLVMNDAARLVGERVSLASNPSVGLFFTRQAGAAARLLLQLCGPLWWVSPAGVTTVGARAGGTITTPATVTDYSGGKGWLTVATEDPASWMPARTFQSNTMVAPITVSATRIKTDNEGVLRLEVLTT